MDLTQLQMGSCSYPFSSLDQPPQGYTWDDVSMVIGWLQLEAYLSIKKAA
jgi:hypothetical protein